MDNNVLVIGIVACLALSCHQQDRSAETEPTSAKDLSPWFFDQQFGWIALELDKEGTVDPIKLDGVARDPARREALYEFLNDIGRSDLFPASFLSIEKFAQSRLTNWLAYPAELDTFPDEITLLGVDTIAEKDSSYAYLAFKFKKNEPHWAAKDGWMIGVVGPYFADSDPTSWPQGTFSRFTKIDEGTAEEEIQWVHENITRQAP